MRFLLLSFLFLFASVSQAQVSRAKMPAPPPAPSYLNVYLLNPELRYERGNSQELEDRRPLNFALAYQAPKFTLLAEYARFTEETGNSTSGIDRTHQDLVLWLRYHAFNSEAGGAKFIFYGAAGAGGYEEEVKTTLMGTSRTDKSSLQFMSGLGAGGEATMAVNKGFAFLAGLEGRALFASDFDPNPVWSAIVRLGIQITL